MCGWKMRQSVGMGWKQDTDAAQRLWLRGRAALLPVMFGMKTLRSS